jgi:GNAT superfamily N-acetyltransferase
MIQEYRNDRYLVSTDRERLQIDVIHGYLRRSYWAEGIPEEIVRTSLSTSLCFGLYDGEIQIGLARVVTDYATFAYLCDVFVLEEYRGQGLGTWMVRCAVAHPELQGVRKWVLGTRDAHGLYAKIGFTPPHNPSHYMEIRRPDIYRRTGNSEE